MEGGEYKIMCHFANVTTAQIDGSFILPLNDQAWQPQVNGRTVGEGGVPIKTPGGCDFHLCPFGMDEDVRGAVSGVWLHAEWLI